MDNQNNRINVVIPKDYNGSPIEVILREGQAPKAIDPKAPLNVEIVGTIDSPLRWLQKRVQLIDQKQAHVYVNRDKMAIILVTNETDEYRKGKIGGYLETSEEVNKFGINTGKQWEPQKLSMFLKMNRAFFTDKANNMSLVSELKNFKAKVNSQVEQFKSENGSYTDNYSQVVDSNLPSSFKVRIPLFKGFAPEEVEVETYADIDGRNVTISLMSAGANETMQDYKNKVIDEQLTLIAEVAPDIVIIEGV